MRKQFMIVGHRQQCRTVHRHAVEQQLEDLLLVARVEIAGGLVSEYQTRLWQQRPADRHALLLTLRKVIDTPAQLVADAHLPCKHDGPDPDIGVQLQGAADAIRVDDIVEDVEVVQQLEVLEYEADVADSEGAPCRIVERTHLGIGAAHPSLLRHQDTGHQVQQRGLAGTARTDDGNLLLRLNPEIRDLQGEFRTGITEGQGLDADH